MSPRLYPLAWIALLVVTSSPATSRAGTLTLTFDLSSSVLDSPVLPRPPTAAASATITLTGVDALGLVTGPSDGAFRSLSLVAMSTARFGPDTLVAVSILASQQGIALGSFDGTNLVLGPRQIRGAFTQILQCLAGPCAELSGPSTAIFSNRTGPTRLALDGLPMSGDARLSGSLLLRLTVESLPVTLMVSGREIARTFEASEPMGLGWLASAVLTLYGLAMVSRERRMARGLSSSARPPGVC